MTAEAPPRPQQALVVDWTRCAGHGVCSAAFRELIALDTWGFPIGVTNRGVPVPDQLAGAARAAVATCPAAALRLARQ